MEILFIATAIVGLISGLWFLYDKTRTLDWRHLVYTRVRRWTDSDPSMSYAVAPLPSGGQAKWPQGLEPQFPEEVSEAVARYFPDFRLPTSNDIGSDWALQGDPETLWPFFSVGNFTGSKGDEYALFVLGQAADTYKLIGLTRNSEGQLLPYELDAGSGSGTDLFVGTVKPGRYRPSPVVQELGEPRVVRLRREGINFGQFEVSDSIFYWDRKRKSFKQVWMLD